MICFSWTHVSTKKMLGCPCYQADGKLFMFLVAKGIVITQLTPVDGERTCKPTLDMTFD